ncbi:retrovirus-related pol polyprotein from transposon TNT 1-94 [Tanacetum coccineum]
MLAPKCATYNGRLTFANPRYLKKAQSEKPCLYEIPYDTSDPANRFAPNREETMTLDNESRSKLDKETVKPYDYTRQNSLYEIFKAPSLEYLYQLERAKEVRKTMWRKPFVRTKPNIAKNVAFLPVSKSISKSRQVYNEMTNNFNHFRTICEQAWSNHTNSAFPNPTAKSMEVLIKTLLMPLSDKTILDSHCFVHELKTEMHDDLEYVKSLEKEIDELESERCVSKDVTCSYLHSLSDLNAYAELQCLYLHKVKECECLAQKLSKQTESVNKEVHNNLLKSFSKLEKHSISLELALQQCKEQMKNNSVCKENGSNVFRKEREQYHEIQDLKAQMQDKNIAISELRKLIENCKGKSVETQFDKPSIVRQPNAQRIPKPSVLGKPTPFSNSPEMRSFQTKQSVNKTNVSDGLFKQVTQQNLPQIRKQAVRNTNVIAPGPSRNNPKHVSFQSPKEFVGSNDMVHNYYLEKAKKSAQLQKDKDVNGKPSMIDPARLPNTANGCKPKPRNWQASMSNRVSNKDVHLEEHRKQKPFLKFNDLQCPTCKKCLYTANHDECVLEYLSKLNPRASAQNKDAKSHNTTKRYVPVEKTSESKKPERLIPKGHRFSHKKTTTVPEKTRTPRSCLRWQPTGRILKTVCLRWVPTGKLFNSCTKDDVSTSIVPPIDIVSRITNIVQLILFIVDSGCTKHMTGNLKLLCNFMEKFLGTVRFGNDQFAPIIGYGDLNQGNVTIKRVYYVEGLNHNLFSGNDLLTGNRGSDLYTISLQETTSSTPICFMAKASPTQAWLWHRRLSHLNFDYTTSTSKKDIVTAPKLKMSNDQLVRTL